MADLPPTVYVGLFATSPTTSEGSATQASASFDHIAAGPLANSEAQAAPILAVLAVTEEYGTELIRVTLAPTPRRAVMLGSKAVKRRRSRPGHGRPAVAASLIGGRLLLPDASLNPGHGYALISIAHGPTLRAALGSVLYIGLIALLGLGIGTVLRDTAVSTGVVLGLLYLPPLLAQLCPAPGVGTLSSSHR